MTETLKDTKRRCPEKAPNGRGCIRPFGHTGPHRIRAYYEWYDDARISAVFRRKRAALQRELNAIKAEHW